MSYIKTTEKVLVRFRLNSTSARPGLFCNFLSTIRVIFFSNTNYELEYEFIRKGLTNLSSSGSYRL